MRKVILGFVGIMMIAAATGCSDGGEGKLPVGGRGLVEAALTAAGQVQAAAVSNNAANPGTGAGIGRPTKGDGPTSGVQLRGSGSLFSFDGEVATAGGKVKVDGSGSLLGTVFNLTIHVTFERFLVRAGDDEIEIDGTLTLAAAATKDTLDVTLRGDLDATRARDGAHDSVDIDVRAHVGPGAITLCGHAGADTLAEGACT